MQIAQIGPWEFEMPEGWKHKENESSNSYFEEPEGTKGLYVKAVELPEPTLTPEQLAEHIQDVHFRGFTDVTNNEWKIVDQRCTGDGELVHSALDLYDAAAKYRVLSLVSCTNQSAIQVTVHDYWCEDYAHAQGTFAQLEASIVKVPSAA